MKYVIIGGIVYLVIGGVYAAVLYPMLPGPNTAVLLPQPAFGDLVGGQIDPGLALLWPYSLVAALVNHFGT
jgi:hypothetical protein